MTKTTKWLETAQASSDGQIQHLLWLREQTYKERYSTLFIINRIKYLLKTGQY